MQNAERSLRFYRNCKVGSPDEMKLQKELAKLKEIAERSKCEEKVKLRDFRKYKALTPKEMIVQNSDAKTKIFQ